MLVIPALVATAWWFLWIVLSLAGKDVPIFPFLLVTGALWGLLEVTRALGEPFAALPLLVNRTILPAPMLRVITEYDRDAMFRLGRQKVLRGPGPGLVFPLGQSVLRSVPGQHELDDMLSRRGELDDVLRKILDEATDPWGITTTAVEIKAIELPDSRERAIARQAEAERERRGKVIAAEGELQASAKLQQGAEVIGRAPAAIQLRCLQTLTEIAAEETERA